jgi:hypoxanthine phosphoribosyltransferase
MDKVKILDKKFKLFLKFNDIDEQVSRIAAQIDVDYEGINPVILGILNGAFVFASDLIKKMKTISQISFLKVATYDGLQSSGHMKEFFGLDIDLNNKHVILVEDIIDSGFTIEKLQKKIVAMNPASLKIASLLIKPESYKKDVVIDYVGFEIPDNFVVGYGLDYEGFGRHLNGIYSLIN